MRFVRRFAPLLLIAATGLPFAAAQDVPPKPPAPDPPKPPAILAQRKRGCGDAAADRAAAAGIDWLLRHQDEDGRWDTDGFQTQCKDAKCGGVGKSFCDPGVTGLATLALLSRGGEPAGTPLGDAVSRAVMYLCEIQDPEGCITPRTNPRFMYIHAAATMALAEQLWLTRDEKLLEPVTKARDFLLSARNPERAWRYGVRDGENDSSVTSWCVLALRSCELAGCDVPRVAYDEAAAWFDVMHERGAVGYERRGGFDARLHPEAEVPPVPRGSESGGAPFAVVALRYGMTRSLYGGWSDRYATGDDARFPVRKHSALAAQVGAAITASDRRDSIELVASVAGFVRERPIAYATDRFLDLHYAMFGSILDAQHPLSPPRPKTKSERDDFELKRRDGWKTWRERAVLELIARQEPASAGCRRGSWDPSLDPFGELGGRVYATSMAVLALEAPNRFPRVWDPDAKPPRRVKAK